MVLTRSYAVSPLTGLHIGWDAAWLAAHEPAFPTGQSDMRVLAALTLEPRPAGLVRAAVSLLCNARVLSAAS